MDFFQTFVESESKSYLLVGFCLVLPLFIPYLVLFQCWNIFRHCLVYNLSVEKKWFVLVGMHGW